MTFNENNITFVGSDNNIMSLSENLCKEKNLSVLEMIRLIKLHTERVDIVEKMKQEEDPRTLYYNGQAIKNIDFSLQKIWGFDMDFSYHIFWNLPKCTCPKVDNVDNYGISGAQIFSSDCPVHNKLFCH